MIGRQKHVLSQSTTPFAFALEVYKNYKPLLLVTRYHIIPDPPTKSKGNPKISKDFPFAEPLKSLEKKGKRHQKSQENRKTTKGRKSQKARKTGGSGMWPFPQHCDSGCFWALASECPTESFLSVFWYLWGRAKKDAKKHSKRTLWGTPSQVPKSTQKHSVGHFPARAPEHFCMRAPPKRAGKLVLRENCRKLSKIFLTLLGDFDVFCPARKMSKSVENIFDTF